MHRTKPADYEPDLKTIWGRLEWSRIQWWERIGRDEGVRPSPRAVADHFGWGRDTYKSHENGLRSKRGLQPEDARKYARAFGVDPGWLATGYGRTFLSPEDIEWAALSQEEKATAIRVAKALSSDERKAS
jgi:hypothetical protein